MNPVLNVLVAAGALAAVAADPAAAQNAKPDASAGADAASGFTSKTVEPIHPFGSINVYNVGLEPTQISAWAKTLNASQTKEMIGRCAVIVQNQQNYLMETSNFCQTFAIAVAQRASGNANSAE